MGASEQVGEQAALTIVVNGEAQVEYHRGKPLTAAQRAYLDRMDEQMSTGISLGDASRAQPDALQRAQFVAIQLLDALQQGNDALIAASCAYLASRLPDLTQVKARLLGGGFSAELVFNQPYVQEEVVNFTPHRLS